MQLLRRRRREKRKHRRTTKVRETRRCTKHCKFRSPGLASSHMNTSKMSSRLVEGRDPIFRISWPEHALTLPIWLNSRLAGRRDWSGRRDACPFADGHSYNISLLEAAGQPVARHERQWRAWQIILLLLWTPEAKIWESAYRIHKPWPTCWRSLNVAGSPGTCWAGFAKRTQHCAARCTGTCNMLHANNVAPKLAPFVCTGAFANRADS